MQILVKSKMAAILNYRGKVPLASTIEQISSHQSLFITMSLVCVFRDLWCMLLWSETTPSHHNLIIYISLFTQILMASHSHCHIPSINRMTKLCIKLNLHSLISHDLWCDQIWLCPLLYILDTFKVSFNGQL